MTTVAEARDAINARWTAGWADRTPYTFANKSYKPDAAVAWARVTVRHEVGLQDTIGEAPNRRFTRGGRIFVQLFVQHGRGTEELDGHMQAAMDVFEGKKFGGVWVAGAVPRDQGDDGPWHVATVEFEFTYEQHK